jgi:hypothetical protein
LFEDAEGPIQHFSWAKFIINGKEHSRDKGAGKDILVYQGEARPWDDMGGHTLTRGSLNVLKGLDIDILIIGNGVHGVVSISDDVKKGIMEIGIKRLIIKETPDACKVYNQNYKKGSKVCLLAHGTC